MRKKNALSIKFFPNSKTIHPAPFPSFSQTNLISFPHGQYNSNGQNSAVLHRQWTFYENIPWDSVYCFSNNLTGKKTPPALLWFSLYYFGQVEATCIAVWFEHNSRRYKGLKREDTFIHSHCCPLQRILNGLEMWVFSCQITGKGSAELSLFRSLKR